MDDEKMQYDESDVSLSCIISVHISSINQQSDAIILSKFCMNIHTDEINDPPDVLISGNMNQQGIVDNDIYQPRCSHPNPNSGQ